MNNKKIKIGLFGFGCVGQGLYEVLGSTPSLNAEIKNICVKNQDKTRPISNLHFCFDKNKILNDPEIDIVVELIDDAEAAFEIVSTALKNKKSVVTANKKMIAEHFDELKYLQTTNNVSLLYEAACCASIPVIRNLEEYYDNDLLGKIEGVVNGSTNYILSNIQSENISYSSALESAQRLGYAESNPELDVSGADAAYKLCILLIHAFGLTIRKDDIFYAGIEKLGYSDLQFAKRNNFRIKLLAHASRTGSGKIAAFVLPRFVTGLDKLYSVEGVFNGIEISSAFADQQFFTGRGAGSLPTASAVLSDISALRYHYKYEYKKLTNTSEAEAHENIILNAYARTDKSNSGRLISEFASIFETGSNQQDAWVTGEISLYSIGRLYNAGVSVILLDSQVKSITEYPTESEKEHCFIPELSL